MSKLIVISGCSGGGKSTLLEELKNNGYSVMPEVGREIVQEQNRLHGNVTPWENPKAFCELAIQRSVENYKNAMLNTETVFFDRCFLDGISYYQTLNVSDVNKYNYLINELRFDHAVFMTPPWSENYVQDDERKHSFEDAVAEYDRLNQFYEECGYTVIEIPKVSVKKRLQFIVSKVFE